MTQEFKVFKIIDKNTGKFSTGGYTPNWTIRGKTWSQINHVKSHLRIFIDDDERNRLWNNKIPENWEVIELSNITGERRYSARSLYPVENIYDPKYIFKRVLLLNLGDPPRYSWFNKQACINHLNELGNAGRLLGELVIADPISPNLISLGDVSHLLYNIESDLNQIYGDIEILHRTPKGKVIKELLDTGIDFNKHFKPIPRMMGRVLEKQIEIIDITTWDLNYIESPELY